MISETPRDTSFSFSSCWNCRPRYTMTLDVLVLREKTQLVESAALLLITSGHNSGLWKTCGWGEFFLSLSSLFSSWLSGGGAFLPTTRWYRRYEEKSWEGIRTHLWKQWAAVRTHWLLIRVPPQECPPPMCRLACHGQAPTGASSPPTILVLSGAMPQTGPKRQIIHVSLRIAA